VGGCNDIDVVTTLLLKGEHHAGQLIETSFLTVVPLTYLPVDTEDAPQTAIRQEDRSRSAPADERIFLPEVRIERSDLEFRRRMTEPFIACESVCSAFSGTEPALFHHLPELLASALQFAGAVKLKVAWFGRGSEGGLVLGGRLSQA
jgi:hypothetical protein